MNPSSNCNGAMEMAWTTTYEPHNQHGIPRDRETATRSWWPVAFASLSDLVISWLSRRFKGDTGKHTTTTRATRPTRTVGQTDRQMVFKVPHITHFHFFIKARGKDSSSVQGWLFAQAYGVQGQQQDASSERFRAASTILPRRRTSIISDYLVFSPEILRWLITASLLRLQLSWFKCLASTPKTMKGTIWLTNTRVISSP
jgi:hypothetical protein